MFCCKLLVLNLWRCGLYVTDGNFHYLRQRISGRVYEVPLKTLPDFFRFKIVNISLHKNSNKTLLWKGCRWNIKNFQLTETVPIFSFSINGAQSVIWWTFNYFSIHFKHSRNHWKDDSKLLKQNELHLNKTWKLKGIVWN